MDKSIITRLHRTFEDYANDKDGVEFWFARDLQNLLGYDRWENFIKVIDKAKITCDKSGHALNDHFLDLTKMVDIETDARRKKLDEEIKK